MAKWKEKKYLKNVIMIVLTLLIIVYVICMFGKASFTQIKSISAAETTVYDSIDVNGYIVRGEQYVEYKENGVISYTVSDGDKVSKEEAVANLFADSVMPGKKQQLSQLEKKLSSLQQIQKNAGTFTQTPDELDRTINSLLVQSNINVANGSMTSADKNVQDILYYINERQIVTGKVNGYEAKIKELEAEISALKKSNSSIQKTDRILAPAAGYFVSRTDGYEKSFDLNALDKLMPGSLSKSKIKQQEVSKNVIGKMIDKVYWYIVCEVNAQEALKIKEAGSLKVNIPVVSNQNIEVELESVNQADTSSDAVVVLKGTYMNEQMATIRNENISIILNEYTGIYVPKSAVHEAELQCNAEDENGKVKKVMKSVPGIYVCLGSEISLKQILPIYSGEDYVISSTDEEDELPSRQTGRVQLYDRIVTEGANLYDGKIIPRTS